MFLYSTLGIAASIPKRLMGFMRKAPSSPMVKCLLAYRQQQCAQTDGEIPLASIYRMYQYIVLGSNLGLRTEIERFFNHPNWAVANIPNPEDPDPARYAILSVIQYFLVAEFNRLIEKSLPRGSPLIICSDKEELRPRPIVPESLPSRVASVSKLPKTLIIPNTDSGVPKAGCYNPQFLSLNIIVVSHTLCLFKLSRFQESSCIVNYKTFI